MKKLILFFTFILSIDTEAQNLVTNPSFEFHTPFPSNMWMNNGDLYTCTPWFRTPSIPGVGGGSTSDYVNTTMPLDIQPGDDYEIQSPHSGYGMASFSTAAYSTVYTISEPFQIRLKEPMEIGETYQVSFYVKKTHYYYVGTCIYGSDEIGVYFNTDTIYVNTMEKDQDDINDYLQLNVMDTTEWGNIYTTFSEFLHTPHVALDTLINDEVNWYLVSDTVYADKPYEFMTFARFNLFEDIQWAIDTTCVGSASSIMLVDDVSVHLVNEEHIEANAGQDTTICIGASVHLGTSEHEDYMYWWSPNEDMETSIYGGVNSGMPWVNPTETTTYTLTQKDYAFLETTDEVTITVEYCPGFSVAETVAETIKIFPNPTKNYIEIESVHTISSWELLDAVGKEVASSKYLVSNRNLVLDVSSFDAGVYYLKLIINNQRIVKNILVK